MQLRRLFQRQTGPERTFIPEVDGFRFIAIVSVVLFHMYGQILRYYATRFPAVPSLMFHNGDRGVRLFFVISGFILSLPFARHYLHGKPAVSVRQYLLRRVTRLEPPYIASLLLQAVLIVLVLHQQMAGVAVHLLASIGYCHNLVFGHMSTISGVAWSLEVEVQFYLLVPFLTSIFAIRSCHMATCDIDRLYSFSRLVTGDLPGLVTMADEYRLPSCVLLSRLSTRRFVSHGKNN